MKLIVGLGNPGKEYEYTRHNTGFMAIDYYAKKHSLDFKNKYNGLYSESIINNEKVILLKPQTFMNLSGECIRKFINFFKVDLKDLLVIYDDVDFEVGTFKIKRNGSSAGHNGIKNIIQNIGTEEFQRIRIGISKNTIKRMDYVLQKFSVEDLNKLNDILPIVSDAIDDFIYHDLDYIMQKYNRNKDE